MNIADNPEVEGKKDVELKNWYYVSKGNRLGPVSENEIRVLIELDEIFPSTNVWRQGLQNWAELNQTELSIMFEYSPPPLLKEEINNSYVWILAFVPFISIIVQVLLSNLTGIGASSF